MDGGRAGMVQIFVQTFDGYGGRLPRRRPPPRRKYLTPRCATLRVSRGPSALCGAGVARLRVVQLAW